jgi:predicted AlkP superfamily pyrophosphatase or phosphodiesterase
MSAFLRVLAGLLTLLQIDSASAEPPIVSRSPSLVVVVVVDQLRHDFAARIEGQLTDGGLKMLLKRGTSFDAAYLGHANTETAPGHASIATGVSPSIHGIVGNSWFSRQVGQPVASVADDKVRTILPTGRYSEGRSPNNLLYPTIGDQLIENSPHSKVYSVSLKDRAAILTSGKRGKAFWYYDEAFSFVTSSYYDSDLPDWIPGLTAECAVSPEAQLTKGDLLTIDLAQNLVEREALGQRGVSDLLYLNLSRTDRIGHQYGWDSGEMIKHFKSLDERLKDFIAVLNRKVGESKLGFIVTADHGAIAESDIDSKPIREVARFYSIEEFGIRLSDLIKDKFGIKERPYVYYHPYLYLKAEVLKNYKVDDAELLEFIISVLKRNGVIADGFLTGKYQEPDVKRQERFRNLVRLNNFPERSGDLFLVPKRGAFLHDDDESREKHLFVLHGSPWDYDLRVPLIIVGPGFEQNRVVNRPVNIAAVAATIGRWLNLPVDPQREAAIEP